MPNLWFTSDHHFSHKGILRFKDDFGLIRPGLSSVEEMDELMIERWNELVKHGDKVYHLGDIYFDHKKFTTQILPRLNGHIRVIVGNHDNIRELCAIRRFEKVLESRKMPEFGIFLSHRPSDKLSLYNWRSKEFLVNIHGHTHSRDNPDKEFYRNICVEKTNYYPLNIDEVRVK